MLYSSRFTDKVQGDGGGDHAAICAENILTLIRDGPKVMVMVISSDTRH